MTFLFFSSVWRARSIGISMNECKPSVFNVSRFLCDRAMCGWFSGLWFIKGCDFFPFFNDLRRIFLSFLWLQLLTYFLSILFSWDFFLLENGYAFFFQLSFFLSSLLLCFPSSPFLFLFFFPLLTSSFLSPFLSFFFVFLTPGVCSMYSTIRYPFFSVEQGNKKIK